MQSNGTYSKYIQLQSTEPCLVKSHFQFNSFDHINSVSLLSNCLAFQINELEFTSLPIKLTLYPNRITTVVLESRIKREITLGNFITMLPDSNSEWPNLQSMLLSDGDDVLCVLPSVNISLFNTQITTRVQIDENRIQFASSLRLFYLGNTNVSGRGSTDRSWESLQLMLQVVFTNDFASELTTYLNTELRDKIEDAVQHIDSTKNTLKSASKQVSSLKQKLQKLYDELLYDIQTSLENNEKRKVKIKEQRDQYEAFLNHTLETYWNATDELSGSIESICQITECERACRSGPVFTLCFVPVTMTLNRSCSYYEQKVVTIHKEMKIPIDICTYSANSVDEFVNFWTPIGLINSNNPHCITKTVYIIDWETVLHVGTILKVGHCPGKVLKGYHNETCEYTSPCAVYEVDPVCDAKNVKCYDNRTKIAINFNKKMSYFPA